MIYVGYLGGVIDGINRSIKKNTSLTKKYDSELGKGNQRVRIE